MNPPKILALDHGLERTGCALSDDTGTIARPLGVITRASSSEGMDTIQQTVEQHGVDLVIVGLPLQLNGTEGLQAQRARSFVGRLRRVIAPIAVELIDERFTTKLARASEADGATAERDALAACHLLQGYLEGRQH